MFGEEIGPPLMGAPRFVSHFRYVAPFRNQRASEATGSNIEAEFDHLKIRASEMSE